MPHPEFYDRLIQFVCIIYIIIIMYVLLKKARRNNNECNCNAMLTVHFATFTIHHSDQCLVCHQKCLILFVGQFLVISCLLFVCCLFVCEYSSNQRRLLFYRLVCHYWHAVAGQRVPISSATKPVF